MRRAAEWMLQESGVAAVLQEVPADVDVAIRSDGQKRIVILTNYGAEPQMIQLPHPMRNVLDGGEASSVSLARFGVAVLQDSAKAE